MIPLALLVNLTNGILSIPPSHWRAVTLGPLGRGTQVEIRYEVRGGSRVQALLLTKSDAERFHRGRSPAPVCSSGFQEEFRMRCRLPEAGDYVLMVDNRIESRTAAMVHVRVDLHEPGSAVVRELPPDRQRVVISLSLAFFGAVVVFSARQFLKHN